MKIKLLGGAEEVGKSAFCIEDKNVNIMLDYGVDIHGEIPEYPMRARHINAIILSHAHLDHSGAIPILYKNEKPDLFINDISLEFVNLLLADSIKIAKKEKLRIPFNQRHIKTMNNCAKLVDYNKIFKVKDFRCELYDAGHIPGSSSIVLEKNNKKILYSGDIKLFSTRLLRGCHLPRKVNTLMIESTYSQTEHKNRENEEKRFRQSIEETIANNNNALIPVFAVGRAQEVLLVLEKYADRIALDGMTKSASEIIFHYKKYIKDFKPLEKILKKVFWIRSREDRDIAIKRCPIIVTTAGMLAGGPIVHYLKVFSENPETKVLFTGYQAEDSPGYDLIEHGVYSRGDEKFPVRCKLERYDFSAHAGKDELFTIIEHLKPENVICIHGDNCKKFAKEINKKLGILALAPKNGDIVEI